MRGASLILSLMLAAMPLASARTAVQAEASAAAIDPEAVVSSVRQIIAQRYVLPDRRPAIDAILAAGLQSGRYARTDARVLAERINADLAEAGQDRHLNFSFNPEQAERLANPALGSLGNQAAFERIARESNHGVTEMRVLAGNIRYVSYDGFYWVGPDSAAAIDGAIRFLAGGSAAIVDLRHNGGGSPDAVQYFISHFLPANRPIVEFHMGGEPEPDRRSTLADLPAGRLIDKPLYVLTSGNTASAAEEFAGHVSGFRIGELIGVNTAGAAFRNELVPIADQFVLSVSVGRPVLAATGGDWERTGIAPTVATSFGEALDMAQFRALQQLASRTQGADRTRLEAMAEGFGARLEPRTPGLPLEAYAGTFGERRVTLVDGRLHYRFGDRPGTSLVPLGGNRFMFDADSNLRLTFDVSEGRATAIQIGPPVGQIQGRYERTS